MRRHSVEQIELKNGAKGLLVHIPKAPVFHYELNFRAGEYLIDQPKKWETAHLLEHVILGANKKYPEARRFSAEVQKNGAITNAYTGYYHIGYWGETADFEWQRLLKLQLLCLNQPLFLQKEFDAEWGNIHDELIASHNQHFRHLGIKIGQSFGFDHPTSKKRSELMKNVKLADIKNFYKKTHTSGNLRFIIAGNLRGRKPKIIDILEKLELENGERYDLPIEKAKPAPKPIFIKNETVENLHLIVSTYRNSMINDSEETALNLTRMMLTDTLHSKIFGTAREKGLVYGVYSSHSRSSQMSEWWLSAQILAENAPALCEIILKEVGNVRSAKISDKDLRDIKRYALGAYQRSLQTVGSIAGSYSRYFFDETVEELDLVPARIKAVTKKDMAESMDSLFTENIGNIGILGGKNPAVAERLHKQISPLWS